MNIPYAAEKVHEWSLTGSDSKFVCDAQSTWRTVDDECTVTTNKQPLCRAAHTDSQGRHLQVQSYSQ